MKKRFPALVLGGILALGLLSGCGQKEAASSVSTAASEPAAAVNGSDQELVFVNYRDIRDLNPHLYAGEMYAQSILYDTLVSNAHQSIVQNALGIHFSCIQMWI